MKSKMEIVIDENNTNIKTYIDLIIKFIIFDKTKKEEFILIDRIIG